MEALSQWMQTGTLIESRQLLGERFEVWLMNGQLRAAKRVEKELIPLALKNLLRSDLNDLPRVIKNCLWQPLGPTLSLEEKLCGGGQKETVTPQSRSELQKLIYTWSHQRISQVSVSGSAIPESDIIILTESLEQLPHVSYLTLKGSSFSEQLGIYLRSGLLKGRVGKLALLYQNISSEGLFALFNGPNKAFPITTLELEGVDETGLKILTEVLPGSNVTRLKLTFSHDIPLASKILRKFYKKIKNTHLTYLDLPWGYKKTAAELKTLLGNNIHKRQELFQKALDNKIRSATDLPFPCLAPDDRGTTALHYACAQGNMEACQILWNEFPIQLADENGELPIDKAYRFGHNELVTYLDPTYEANRRINLPLAQPNNENDSDVPLVSLNASQPSRPLQPTTQQPALETTLNLVDQFEKLRSQGKSQDSPLMEELKTQIESKLGEFWAKIEQINTLDAVIEAGITQTKKLEQFRRELDQQEEELKKSRLILANPQGVSQRILDELQNRVTKLEQEIKPLQVDYEKRTNLQKKLEVLFELDEDDPRRSIETFYQSTLDRLTAFSIGVKAISSGLVDRSDGWKDGFARGVFGFLSFAGDIAGVAGAGAWGAGAIIPFVVKPVLAGGELAWDRYRSWKKNKEFKRASAYFDGGFSQIDQQNRYVAYALAHMLQMQLPHCTVKGAQKIVDDWLTKLTYSIMKRKGGTDDDASNIVSTILRIDKSKSVNHSITTLVKKRGWETEELFEYAGVAYYDFDGVPHHESCYSRKQKDVPEIREFTKARKYGYLFFPSFEEATFYKEKMAQEIIEKEHGKVTLEWRRNTPPLGPEEKKGDQPSVAARRRTEEVATSLKIFTEVYEKKHATTTLDVDSNARRITILENDNIKLTEELKKMKTMMDQLLSQLDNK